MRNLKVINLSATFTPFPMLETAATVKHIDYPSGCEPHIRLENMTDRVEDLILTARIHTLADLFRLTLLKNACFHQWRGSDGNTSVFIPYLPHARQDRVAVPGDAHSLQEVCRLLSNQCFTQVNVFDLHNIDAVINEMVPFKNWAPSPLWQLAWKAESEHTDEKILVIHPDQGAVKRFNGYYPSASHYLVCDKYRNPADGKLKITVPEHDVTNRVCIILDDICDGGGTFIPVARELKIRGARRVVLCMSHGLFTKGLAPLIDAGIDMVYTTNSFKDHGTHPYLTSLNDWSFILADR